MRMYPLLTTLGRKKQFCNVVEERVFFFFFFHCKASSFTIVCLKAEKKRKTSMWLNYSCIKSFSWLEPLPAVYIIQWAALVSWTIWATTLAFTFYSPCYCYRFFWTSYISLLLYCSLLIDCRIVALLHWLCSQRCTCEWIWKNHAVIFWGNVA